MKEKRVIFMGTPTFAVPILDALNENTTVVGVISQENKEVGRKKEIIKTPIALYADNNNLYLLQPKKIKDAKEEIKKLNPDIIITCAYGQIIPEDILNIPEYGSINVHASLLPKYRGGAPIQYAILNGESKTGITIMYMDKGMDTGDMITKEVVEIEDDDNLETLSNKLSLCGKNLLIKTLPSIFNKTNNKEKQDEKEASYAPIIKKEDELLDFNRRSVDVLNKIRALSPSPGCYFMMDNKRIKVYDAYVVENKRGETSVISAIHKDGFSVSTIDGEVVITLLQAEGKKKMSGSDYLNGINKSSIINKKIN